MDHTSNSTRKSHDCPSAIVMRENRNPNSLYSYTYFLILFYFILKWTQFLLAVIRDFLFVSVLSRLPLPVDVFMFFTYLKKCIRFICRFFRESFVHDFRTCLLFVYNKISRGSFFFQKSQIDLATKCRRNKYSHSRIIHGGQNG